MITYHFSVGFTDSIIKHHGSFESYIEPNQSQELVKIAKRFLLIKLITWKRKQEDVISFEVYYYEKEKEISIFKYEKQ